MMENLYLSKGVGDLITRPQMFCFPLKVSVKRKKKVFIVRDDASHFLQDPIVLACSAYT